MKQKIGVISYQEEIRAAIDRDQSTMLIILILSLHCEILGFVHEWHFAYLATCSRHTQTVNLSLVG